MGAFKKGILGDFYGTVGTVVRQIFPDLCVMRNLCPFYSGRPFITNRHK